ncbi:hypothetical protein [Streptomyces sp. 2231.1]|uniref:hypothetical protein n=1 Tax=Streptomyces sp. 2231.1 TaxID=1855347 RepID=UPI0015A3D420
MKWAQLSQWAATTRRAPRSRAAVAVPVPSTTRRRRRRGGVVEDGQAGRAGEEDGGVDRGVPRGDLPDQVQGGVVAADVDAGQVGGGEQEAGDLADDRLGALGAG